MATQWTSNRQFVTPALDSPAVLTPSGTAWTSSGWVSLLAAADADAVLTGLTVRTTHPATVQFEVDIAVGAGHTIIATRKGISKQLSATVIGAPLDIPFPIPIDAIPNGDEVFARIRTNSTSTIAWSVRMRYLKKSITGTLLTTATPTKVAPSGSALIALTTGATWTYGAWVEVIAAAAADLVLVGLILEGATATRSWDVQLGLGTAGSETPVNLLPGYTAGVACAPWSVPLWNPFDGIPSGSRVAMRGRNNGAAISILAGLEYHEKPL